MELPELQKPEINVFLNSILNRNKAVELVSGKRRPLARGKERNEELLCRTKEEPTPTSSPTVTRRQSPTDFAQAFRKAGRGSPVVSYASRKKAVVEGGGRPVKPVKPWSPNDSDTDSDEWGA